MDARWKDLEAWWKNVNDDAWMQLLLSASVRVAIALLALYMGQQLLLPGHAEHVLGLAALLLGACGDSSTLPEGAAVGQKLLILKDGAGGGRVLIEVPPHTDSLRALAGKDKGEVGHRAKGSPDESRGGRFTCSVASVRPLAVRCEDHARRPPSPNEKPPRTRSHHRATL